MMPLTFWAGVVVGAFGALLLIVAVGGVIMWLSGGMALDNPKVPGHLESTE